MISRKLSKVKFAILALMIGVFAANIMEAAYPNLPTFTRNYYVIEDWELQTADGSETLWTESGNNTQYAIGQTSTPVVLEAGQTYRMSFVGLGYYTNTTTCNRMNAYGWIDWNGNESFADPGERMLDYYYSYVYPIYNADPGNSQYPWVYFTVPESAQGLTFRIRIAGVPYYYGYPPANGTGSGPYYGDAGDLAIFVPAPPTDASATEITQPPQAFSTGTQNIAVNLRNNYERPLESCRIIWRIDEGLATESSNTFNWTGSLEQDEEEEVVVGTFDFTERRTYTIDAFTEWPNDEEDDDHSNDRATTRFVAPALQPDNYYIGAYSSSSNTFATLADAGDYIGSAGILGDGVLYLILPDMDLGDPNYQGPISINSYPSMGDNSIVIKSESNDPTKVTVEFEPDAANQFLFSANTSSNITVEGITFEVDDANGYAGIMNFQACDNITVDNCVFDNVVGAPISNNYVTLNIAEGYDINVTNNTFNDGAIAINEASFCPRKMNVSGNSFNNATGMSVSLYGNSDGNPCTENDVMVDGNTFISDAPYAIMSTNGTEITDNSFSGFDGVDAMSSVIYVTNNDPTNFTGQTMISGNEIFSALVDINGIYAVDVPNINISENNISVTDDALGLPNWTTHAVSLSNCGNSSTPAYVQDNQIEYNNGEDGNAMNLMNSYVNILRNDIDMPSGGMSQYSIYANTINGYVANNQIGAENSTCVFLDNSNVGFYYNTLATTATIPVLRINAGTNTIMRNIVQNVGVGPAIVASNAGGNTLDENNYFTTGTVLGQWAGANAADLAAWQMTSGKDANSINMEISFIDLATFDLGLNTFTEDMVYDAPLSFGSPEIEEEVQGTDYNGNTRNSYFMGSENIIPEIFINAQPETVMDCIGNTGHSINVVAHVTRGVIARYEWFKDGVSLTSIYENPGMDDWANKAALFLDSLPFAPEDGGLNFEMEGVYRCLVRGSGAEPQYSDYALVNVLSPAVITRQPEDQRAVLGGEVIFEVEAHIVADEGVDDPFYQPEVQWYRGSIDNPIEDDLSIDGKFMGARTTILSVRNISNNEIADDYFVVLRGACDSLYSEMVSIKEFPQVFITESPATQSVCEGEPVTFEVTANATDSEAIVEYQWRKDGMAIQGADMASYTIDMVTADLLGMYDCIVTVLPGGATETSEAAELTMKMPPSITLQPVDQNGVVGSPFILLIAADGEEPLTYQWYKDDVVIDGATSSSYSVAAATLEDAGVYACEATNVCNSVMSDPANVTVTEEGMVGVEDMTNGGFVLEDNSPNPFTETTTIRYFAPTTTAVRLAITDVYGKEITVLVDGTKAGWNEAKVNANTLSSGVYYYTLTSGNYSITRKMVVLK